eukprot:TRINITY_DN6213_c0_g1_i2.p1 TRINITY_DN6213_c0_g1~~TRINITY_DN6213_c0_g1_i2.p1  ORF type:complete len:109 (+),score=16.93 TRINITY_DN6213_c0_g1_i2:105-431(+)
MRFATEVKDIPRTGITDSELPIPATGFLPAVEVRHRVISVVQGFEKVKDKSKVSLSTKFGPDLGLDSLDEVELVMALEEEFQIDIKDQEIGRAVQQECRDRSRMPSSA